MNSKTSLHLVQLRTHESRADDRAESTYLLRADRRSTYSRWIAGEASRPRVSLIVPALNEEKSIGAVLRDIPRPWVDEVIVVDNGSTDRTAAIARSRRQGGSPATARLRRGVPQGPHGCATRKRNHRLSRR